MPSVVLERNPYVGGLAATIDYKGYLFDIGGHRFYSKVSMVERLWKEVLGDDFLERPRLSRIYYNSNYFHYPLQPWDALRKLGPVESLMCMFSYLYAHFHPELPEETFASWVRNRFGDRLYRIFFKAYTEKVWGIPCEEIRAEWAAQRIRGLSMKSLVLETVLPIHKGRTKAIKTLIRSFHYPRLGPGMMWNRMKEIVEKRGSSVLLDTPVDKIVWRPGAVEQVHAGGEVYRPLHIISSLALRDLLELLDPKPPDEILKATSMLRYRDFLTVAVIVKGEHLFPDNWIYVHDPRVRLARIQNYKNWSPEMVPDPGTTCLGLEYFCQEGDGLWNSKDEDLIALGRREVAELGLAPADSFLDGTVVREKKAYPVYDGDYQEGVRLVRKFLEQVPNLQVVGRNGMHRYNNQDHSMLTAILAARNILGANYDLWNIHVDEDYLEEGEGITDAELEAFEQSQPAVPRRISANSSAGAERFGRKNRSA